MERRAVALGRPGGRWRSIPQGNGGRPPYPAGVLMPLAADDPEAQLRLAALAQGLQQLGWTIGRNVRIETRWSAGNADDIRLGLEVPPTLLARADEVIE